MNFFILLSFLTFSLCWSPDDISIFQLQSSLRSHFGRQANFYSVLEINRDASEKEITRAYRKVSLTYHPDKNSAEDAKEIYKLLTSIQSILKTEKLKKLYDLHLKKGFPVERAGGFFYEKWEPGLFTTVLFLLGVVSMGQYVTLWIFYFQKTRVVEKEPEPVPFKTKSQRKKEEKKGISTPVEEVVEEEVVKMPSVLDLVIFTLPLFAFDKIKGLFSTSPAALKVNKQD